MEENEYWIPHIEDVSGQNPVSGYIDDGRTWSEGDWVYWPASTNVHSARYCRDGSLYMQVKYGGKFKHRPKGKSFWDPVRFYEYGPDLRLTWDLWHDFCFVWSKGHFSWSHLDPRWSNSIPYRRIL
jgi:hypothetical protein